MAKAADAPPRPRNYPYRDGSIIKLDYYSEDREEYEPDANNTAEHARKSIPLSLKVVRTLATTFSCVLLVKPTSSSRNGAHAARLLKSKRPPPKSQMILKLCDRRFSKGLRDDYEAAEWAPDIEAAYVAFQNLPDDQRPEIRVADDFEGDSWHDGDDSGNKSTGCDSDESGDEQDGGYKLTRRVSNEHWPAGHREAYLQKWCDKLYAQELEVYRNLADVQGEKIPILYGTVSVRDKTRRSQRIEQVQGLLMEYKNPSFPLRDIPERIPNRDLWHDIGKASVKLVQEIGDMGVLNRDIRLDNILVVPVQDRASPNSSWELIPSFRQLELEGETESFKVFMIDFGIARIQGEDETDEEFRKARRSQDEEGAIGYVLEQYLMRNAGGEKPFKFNHSRRLERPWDDDEADI